LQLNVFYQVKGERALDYQSFCQKYKPTKQQLYTEFYQLFKEKFSIKSERIAIKKLCNIIEATFTLAANQSFANMSLRQLSKTSGLSMGGLYAYIQNKQQLALFIHEFLSYFVTKTINQVTNKKECNTLECIIKTHIYLSEFLQPWFFFAFMESKNLSRDEKKSAIQSDLLMEKKLIKVIKTGQQQGIYNKVLKAETVASLTKPLLSEWYLKRWKYKKRNLSIDEYCAAVMIFINQGLRERS